MCGRFEIHSTLAIIASIFGIMDSLGFDFTQNYNIAPGQDVMLAVQNGKRKLIMSRWGFVPSWSKDLNTGYKMINARAETLSEKRSFKTAYEKHRCLVIADGFFEWKKEGAIKKPYYIHLKSGQPFGFAGLYNIWKSPEGEGIITSTIITTNANKLIMPIHDRMPVIIPPEKYDEWLDSSAHDTGGVAPLLQPYESDMMELYPVTRRMNSYKYNKPENIAQVELE